MFCRFCALDKLNTFVITELDNFNNLINIFEFLSINIEDNLPNNICDNCLNLLYKLKEFKDNVEKSQKSLETIFEEKLKDNQIEETKILNCDDLELNSNSNGSLINVIEYDEYNAVEEEFNILEENEYYEVIVKEDEESEDYEKFELIEINSESNLLETTKLTPKSKVRRKVFKELECNQCGSIKNSIKELIQHFQLEHADQNVVFKCPFCMKIYERYRSFTRHVIIHTDGARFKCELCDRTFSQKISLQNHYLSHDTDKNFECSKCEMKFKQYASLYNHMKIHSDKLFHCNYCDSDFRSIYLLKQHENTKHLKIKDKSCKVCGKKYSSSSALSYHQQSHQKNRKKIKCKECEKEFVNVSVLNKHINTSHVVQEKKITEES